MELVGKKIILTGIRDNSVYFVHSLAKNKKLVEKNDEYQLFYIEDYDFYIYYLTNLQPNDYLKSVIKSLSKNNYLHYVMSDCNDEFVINFLEKEIDFKNFDYSIVFNFGETINNNQPYLIDAYKNVKYFFSSTKTINRKDLFIWPYENTNKFIFDIKYGLLFAYFKFGLNNHLHIETNYENKNKKDKIFVYSKVGDRIDRINAIRLIENIDRFYKKKFNEEDWFWHYTNYNQYHISFYTDYTTCKFNLVFETFTELYDDVLFLTEKTCKALITNTPFYLNTNKVLVNELHDNRFYTLNKNFENYEKFVTFMEQCSDEEFENLYLETRELSKNNKKILEDYIYSDKVKEINLLINK
jgi:hypothetical protein